MVLLLSQFLNFAIVQFLSFLLNSLCFSFSGWLLVWTLHLLPHEQAGSEGRRQQPFRIQGCRTAWYIFFTMSEMGLKCVGRGSSHQSAAQTPSTRASEIKRKSRKILTLFWNVFLYDELPTGPYQDDGDQQWHQGLSFLNDSMYKEPNSIQLGREKSKFRNLTTKWMFSPYCKWSSSWGDSLPEWLWKVWDSVNASYLRKVHLLHRSKFSFIQIHPKCWSLWVELLARKRQILSPRITLMSCLKWIIILLFHGWKVLTRLVRTRSHQVLCSLVSQNTDKQPREDTGAYLQSPLHPALIIQAHTHAHTRTYTHMHI